MRALFLGLVVVGISACGSPATNFEHRSELEFATRGVGLDPDGRYAVVGMMNTTCQITVADAAMGSDYNFPTDEETVQDHSTLLDQAAVVVVSDFGSHVTFPDRGWDISAEDYNRPNAIEGRVFEEGVVVLGDDAETGCGVEFVYGADSTRVGIADTWCSGAGMTVDRATGQTWLAGGDKVLTVDGELATELPVEADLVVWDSAAQVLYAALVGDTVLYGFEADGRARWSADLAGEIVDVEAMGPSAQALVMLAAENGLGELVTVDGHTGVVTTSLVTPEPALDIDVSDNGKAMALSLPREVHFFEVHLPE